MIFKNESAAGSVFISYLKDLRHVEDTKRIGLRDEQSSPQP